MSRVFISYSRDDASFRDALTKHLQVLCSAGIVTKWDDQHIAAGEDWKSAIDRELCAADIVVLLISASFLSSQLCQDFELGPALRRWHEKKLTIIPVIVRSCAWEVSPVARMQLLPSEGTPVAMWAHPDEAWANVIRAIRVAATSLRDDQRTAGVSIPVRPNSHLPMHSGQQPHDPTRVKVLDSTTLVLCVAVASAVGAVASFGFVAGVFCVLLAVVLIVAASATRPLRVRRLVGVHSAQFLIGVAHIGVSLLAVGVVTMALNPRDAAEDAGALLPAIYRDFQDSSITADSDEAGHLDYTDQVCSETELLLTEPGTEPEDQSNCSAQEESAANSTPLLSFESLASLDCGQLPMDTISRAVQLTIEPLIINCYRLMSLSIASGSLSVRFMIGRDGNVSGVRNEGSDLPDTFVVSCVLRAFSHLSFPHASCPQTVVMPLDFSFEPNTVSRPDAHLTLNGYVISLTDAGTIDPTIQYGDDKHSQHALPSIRRDSGRSLGPDVSPKRTINPPSEARPNDAEH